MTGNVTYHATGTDHYKTGGLGRENQSKEVLGTLRVLSICQNFNNYLKATFYASPSKFFKIVNTIFRVIIFQDFAGPSLQSGAFDIQTGRSGWPVLENRKYS